MVAVRGATGEEVVEPLGVLLYGRQPRLGGVLAGRLFDITARRYEKAREVARTRGVRMPMLDT